MNRGKDICKELKAVRKRIAEENDIPLEIKECTYNGPCKGTCPRCESEVRYLENALADRLRRGKVATVAGLALGLAVSSGVKAQSTDPPAAPTSPNLGEERNGMCEVTGVVVDGRNHEPLPFVNVEVWRNGSDVASTARTDFDGRYRFSVPAGHYFLKTCCAGYETYRCELDVKSTNAEQTPVEMQATGIVLDTVTIEAVRMGLVAVTFQVQDTIVDEKTSEPLPFVNVIVRKDGRQYTGATSDFDGIFQLALEEGEYEFEISTIGYELQRISVKVPQDLPLKAIKLKTSSVQFDGTIGIIDEKIPLVDPTAPGQVHGMEVQGVQVKVQY